MSKQTRGFCKYCGKEYTKGGMLKHLAACKERRAVLDSEPGKSRCGYFELVIMGRYTRQYWLIIEIRDTATLKDLDQFLRDIWVECCGHLSAFDICGERYDSEMAEMGMDLWDLSAKSMNHKLKDVLSEGMAFEYEYDFGSTTTLVIEAHDYRVGVRKKEKITILSRNNPPEILCSVCETNQAEWVDTEGFYEGVPFWCEECRQSRRNESLGEAEADEDEYDEDEYEYYDDDFLLPVCNSPRMGVCGYEGSSRYPDCFEPDKKYQNKKKK